jgi:hypothetical protein
VLLSGELYPIYQVLDEFNWSRSLCGAILFPVWIESVSLAQQFYSSFSTGNAVEKWDVRFNTSIGYYF